MKKMKSIFTDPVESHRHFNPDSDNHIHGTCSHHSGEDSLSLRRHDMQKRGLRYDN